MKLLCKTSGHEMEKIRDINEFDWVEKCSRCGETRIMGKRIQIWNVNLDKINEDYWIKPK